MLVVVVVAFAGPRLAPVDPLEQHVAQRLAPPGTTIREGGIYVLGSDQLGRDVFSRLLDGGRQSVSIALASVLLAALIGVTAGLVGGYFGGWIEGVIMRAVDIQLGFPGILLAITLVVVLGGGAVNLIIALGISRWVTYARMVRASALTLKHEEFVTAARALGAPSSRILVRHILPNAAGPVIVIASLHIGQIILAEASLSFLGLGVPPPAPSWGSMVNDGRNYLDNAWWIAAFPGLAIAALVVAAGTWGDSLRDVVSPSTQLV